MLVFSMRRSSLYSHAKITQAKSVSNIKISSQNTLIKGSKEPKEPLVTTKVINRFGQAWQNFLNGFPGEEKSEINKNHDKLKQYYDVLQVQQSFCEDILDGSSVHRFGDFLHGDETLTRFDNSPKNNISFRQIESDSNQDYVWIEGILKSHLNEKGQIVPVAQVPEDIYFECRPKTLANLAYQHVMALNKNQFRIQIEKDLSQDKLEKLKEPEVEKLHQKTKAGSPITSTTKNPPIMEKLAQWGVAGESIEIVTDQLKVLPPSKLAYLIMHHANIDGIDQPSKKKWRENKECFSSINCEEVKIMEKKLKEVGVDPDGLWTKREVAVFYVLVADEHMIIGMTPEGSAKIVERKKESL